MKDSLKAYLTLATCTFSSFISIATWAMNSVLVVYFLNKGIFTFSSFEIGLLIAAPFLTGALCRIPLGILTDHYGGRVLFPITMLISALFFVLYSFGNSYVYFLIMSFGFGLSGGVFAVGAPYLMLWFPKERQGRAIGIFILAGSGVALTSIVAPLLLNYFTNNGTNLEHWRDLPRFYAALMVLTSTLFCFFAFSRKNEEKEKKTFFDKIKFCTNIRVLRFGLYYAFSFGGFIAVSQWIILYYVSVYGISVKEAGLYATIYSVPSALIGVLGGILADTIGPRRVMYSVFGLSIIVCLLLVFPKMELTSFGRGVYATCDGMVTAVTQKEISVEAGGKTVPFALTEKPKIDTIFSTEENAFLPKIAYWHESKVQKGERVVKNTLLAYGITHLYFNPPLWFFTFLIFLLGLLFGIGIVGVFKYIPHYFERDIGVVSGVVSAIGCIGGFFLPIFFSFLLDATGFWTSCWLLLGALSLICLLWLHKTVQGLMKEETLLIKSLL